MVSGMSDAKATVENLLRSGKLLINIATSSNYPDTVRVEALRRMNLNVRTLRIYKERT